jgi:hypothetical protein
MPASPKRPKLTRARALFICLMQRYRTMGYRLTLLEMQKLAYLLQEGREPLRLNYVAGHYGPDAHNLNKVLERLEGHFIRGYGDSQKPDVEIELLADAAKEAEQFLSQHEAAQHRLRRISEVIEGFETPYGMELLASVHWVAVRAAPGVGDAEGAVQAVHSWNDRKREMFRPEHIRVAWTRLQESGWLAGGGTQPQ